MNETAFFQYVSLSEFVLLIYFASGLLDGDLYKMFFLSLALLKHIPEQFLKWLFTQYPRLHDLNKRPSGARDCNSLNKGGPNGPKRDVDKYKSTYTITTTGGLRVETNESFDKWNKSTDGHPGMPSGHSTVIAMYFVLHLSNIVYLSTIKKAKINIRAIILMVVFSIGFLFLGMARIRLKCHTVPQVIAGYILGTVIGLIGFVVSQKMCSTYPKFKNSFLQFYTQS